LADEVEEPVFDFVPLAGAGRQVANLGRRDRTTTPLIEEEGPLPKTAV